MIELLISRIWIVDKTGKIMVSCFSSYQDLENHYRQHSIPIDEPGFYDDSNFVQFEQKDVRYLETYAAFVAKKEYSDSYLAKARREIPIIVRCMYNELVRDGRLGACVDICLVLSRILEREGYWNYIVKGSVNINFPEESKIGKKYFWTFDDTINTDVGHVWCVAPPFKVIDITIKQQPYRSGESAYLPSFVLGGEVTEDSISPDELCSPSFLDKRREMGLADDQVMATLEDCFSVFKPVLFTYGKTAIKYITCGITAPDADLEDIKCLELSGRHGIEVYKTVIAPELDRIRQD